MMTKLIVVGGPTASGKTELALEIAKKYNGEIINADSRQIYKYLDIGTNKGPVQETGAHMLLDVPNYKLQNPFTPQLFEVEVPIYTLNQVPVYLLSFLYPDERFNVFRFKKLAEHVIKQMNNRGKLPILVGGTGLYIDAIVKDYQEDDLSDYYDDNYRNYLSSLDIAILQKMVEQANPALYSTLNESDKNNPRRLSRLLEKLKAIEIKGDAEKVTKVEDTYASAKAPVFDLTFLYPEYTWDQLKERIDKRAEKMFEHGLVEETQKVLDMGYQKTCPAFTGVGYPEVIDYLDEKVSLEQALENLKTAHKQYARKQRTWFEGGNRGYDLIKVTDIDSVADIIQ